MRPLVVAVCLALVACSGEAEPDAREAPSPTAAPPAATAPAPDPACPNQEAVVEDDSLRTGEDLPGDVDGDGATDSVSIYFDPSGEQGCQAFVVAQLEAGGVTAGSLETWRADFGLPRPTLNALYDVDGDGVVPEIVVNMGVGASTQFVGIVKEDDGVLRQVTVDGPAAQGSVGDGVFGFGGSVGHLEAVDCAAGDTIVSSFAAPDGDVYKVERTFLAFEGAELVRVDEEVERVPIEQIDRFPEYAASPFGSCG